MILAYLKEMEIFLTPSISKVIIVPSCYECVIHLPLVYTYLLYTIKTKMRVIFTTFGCSFAQGVNKLWISPADRRIWAWA